MCFFTYTIALDWRFIESIVEWDAEVCAFFFMDVWVVVLLYSPAMRNEVCVLCTQCYIQSSIQSFSHPVSSQWFLSCTWLVKLRLMLHWNVEIIANFSSKFSNIGLILQFRVAVHELQLILCRGFHTKWGTELQQQSKENSSRNGFTKIKINFRCFHCVF